MALDRTTTLMLRGLMVVAAAGVITVSGVAVYNAQQDEDDTDDVVALSVSPVQTPTPMPWPTIDPNSYEGMNYLSALRDKWPGMQAVPDDAFFTIGRQACTLLQADDDPIAVANQIVDEADADVSEKVIYSMVVEAKRYFC